MRSQKRKKQPVYYKFLQCGTFLLLFSVSPEKYLFSFSVPTSKQRRKACFLSFYATVDTSPTRKTSRLFLGTSEGYVIYSPRAAPSVNKSQIPSLPKNIPYSLQASDKVKCAKKSLLRWIVKITSGNVRRRVEGDTYLL